MGLRNTGTWLGFVEDEAMYAEQLPGESYADDAGAEYQDRFGDQAAPDFQIASLRPRNFRDARTIGEYFREDIPVIFNLEEMDTPQAKRIVDFACGLIFGRHGSLERLSSRVFLLLPQHGSIVTEPSGLADQGFFNQA